MYDEDDYLLLSGIQHFSFCPRQWALIHIEGQWAENLRTVEGHIVHERVHDERLKEKRRDVIVLRGLRVQSAKLGITGQCDAVEFHQDDEGTPLHGYDGNWIPYPIEYKKGKPKDFLADRLQLCAEAICLEEMFCCQVPKGALYYDEIHRREEIVFSPELRDTVRHMTEEMHHYMSNGYTPRIKPARHCNACSLKPICLPQNYKQQDVTSYYKSHLGEGE